MLLRALRCGDALRSPASAGNTSPAAAAAASAAAAVLQNPVYRETEYQRAKRKYAQEAKVMTDRYRKELQERKQQQQRQRLLERQASLVARAERHRLKLQRRRAHSEVLSEIAKADREVLEKAMAVRQRAAKKSSAKVQDMRRYQLHNLRTERPSWILNPDADVTEALFDRQVIPHPGFWPHSASFAVADTVPSRSKFS